MERVGVWDLKQNASRVLERILGTQDVLAAQPVTVAPGIRLSDDLTALREGEVA